MDKEFVNANDGKKMDIWKEFVIMSVINPFLSVGLRFARWGDRRPLSCCEPEP